MNDIHWSLAAVPPEETPPDEPVTVAELAAHLNLSDSMAADTDEQTLLRGLISKSRRYVEQRLGRQLVTGNWVLSLDRWPREIRIPKNPVQSIETVEYTNGAGSQVELSGSLYQVDILSQPARIRPVYGGSWPEVRPGYNAIQVAFTAGYGDAATDVPETLRHAILLLAAHWHEVREPVADKVMSPVPMTVDDLLALEAVDWTW